MSQKDFLFAIIPTFVLISCIFTTNYNIPVKASDTAYSSPAHAHDKASKAYYRLRSCHRLLREESGEFFSPDFLCSNPPLWCNWTIQASPGRRIRLQLEDYTTAESCHLKRDQIHLDESLGSGRHRTLQQCWQNAVYTSDSSTLYLVLLIEGSLEPTYRGFRARYHVFGLPHTPPASPPPSSSIKGNDLNWGGEMVEELFAVHKEEKPAIEQAQMDADPTLSSQTDSPSQKESSITKFLSPEQPIRTTPAGKASSDASPAPSGVSDIQASEAEDSGPAKEGGTQPKRDSGDPLKNAKDPSDDLGVSDGPAMGDPSKERLLDMDTVPDLRSVDPSDQGPVQRQPAPPDITSPAPIITDSLPKALASAAPSGFPEQEPDDDSSAAGSRSTRKPREEWDEDMGPGRSALNADGDLPSGSIRRKETGIARGGSSAKPSATPPTLEGSLKGRTNSFRLQNTSALASLPGEHLFEVSVEVHLVPNINENWDHLIQDELRAHVVPKSISSIRIKRLSAGVLYIFWLYFGEKLEGLQVHRVLNMALLRLQERTVTTRGRKDPATIAFISSEDINECGTQLVLCDINAECINRFGSYACRCNPGFQDKSRLGSGGTLCVAPSGTGPTQSQPPSSSSALLNCLYGLCFLLGFFVILLLCIVGALYRRHHRGAFMLPCHSHENGSSRGSDAGATPNGSQLPPPPPPVRRPKDGWGHPKDKCPSTDLPLLKFAPLTPSDSTRCQEQEGDKL